MKKWLLIPPFAAAICGVLALLPHASGQTGGSAGRTGRAARPAAIKIAVVDVGQILRHYKKATALLDEVKASSEANNSKIKQIHSKGKELAKTLEDGSIDPETPEFRDTATKIFQLESYIKSYKASAERDLKAQGAQATLAVYNDLQDALKVFSEKNGFTIIVKVDREAATATDPQALGRVASQDVIFHQNRDDITSAVIAYLNSRYESAPRSEAASGDPSSPAPAKTPPSVTPARKSNPR